MSMKKLVALMMAFIMLFSMMPTSFADGSGSLQLNVVSRGLTFSGDSSTFTADSATATATYGGSGAQIPAGTPIDATKNPKFDLTINKRFNTIEDMKDSSGQVIKEWSIDLKQYDNAHLLDIADMPVGVRMEYNGVYQGTFTILNGVLYIHYDEEYLNSIGPNTPVDIRITRQCGLTQVTDQTKV